MSLIEDTWRQISGRMVERGMPLREVLNLREGFTAGVNAAAAAIVSERAGYAELSDAATRVERSN